MTTPWSRVLKFDAVNNFRDYGGWHAANGARVVTGKLFRSAHQARATAADLDRIRALDIVTVTDLRHPSEQREQPSAWIGRLSLTMIEEPEAEEGRNGGAPHMIALRESDFSRDAMLAFLTSHYGEMPYDPRHVALFSRYFNTLSASGGSMLIHCAAGKDRTGILAALTHHLLGVHPDDAMEDYLLSNEAGAVGERWPHLHERMEKTYNRPIAKEALEALLRVYPQYLARCWAALNERSGSKDAYLTDVLGIDDEKRRRIQERLLS